MTPRSLTTAPHADFELELVSGTWPDDISGEMVFSSPQRCTPMDYAIFDWGAICRLALRPGTRGATPGRFAWQSRSIQSPGKRLWDRHPEQFSTAATGYQSVFGSANASNTAPLPWGGRLFTTWDAGRPIELHPGTLEFVAEVGHRDSWGGPSLDIPGVLPFLLSSAHPVVDPDRDCMWSAKLDFVMQPSFGMRPAVVRYDGADGTQVRYWPLDGVVFGGSTHTVSQTRDWVILADSGNFKPDPAEMFGGERELTIDDEVPVWLIRKDQLEGLPTGTPVTPIRLMMAPPTGHFYPRWDDTDGISVVWEGMDMMDLALYLRPDDVDVNGNPMDPAVVGLYNMGMAPDTIVEVLFEPESGKVIERGLCREDWTFNLQLSAMDWSTEGMDRPTLHHVTYQGCRPGNISRRAAELYEGRIDLDQLREATPGALATFERGSMELKARWEYPDLGDHISSPTFAPRSCGADAGQSAYAGGEPGGHDGYVVQPVLSDNGFRVELFDAASVGQGPIAVLQGTNRECIPLVLHSAWMPAHDELVDAERLRFSDELSDEQMAAVPDELHGAIRSVAEECDHLIDSRDVTRLLGPIAELKGQEPALIDERGSTTWVEFDTRTNRLIDALRARGLEPGSTIALMSGNRREAFEVTAAAAHAAWVIVPVNWHWVADELAYVIDDAGADALIVEDRFSAVGRAAIDRLDGPRPVHIVIGDARDSDDMDDDGSAGVADHGVEEYESVLASGSPAEPADQAMGGPMFYTSGTTGFPKGVRSALTAVGADVVMLDLIASGFSDMLGLPEDGVTLLAGPMYHSAQWVFAMFPLVGRRSTVVMRHQFDPAETLELIDRHAVTNVHLVPTQFVRMLKLPESERETFDGSSLVVAYHGGAPCPPAVKRSMLEWWGPRVSEYYGGTEGGFLTQISGTEWLERPGSIGRALSTLDLRVVDDDGDECAANISGQIYFKSLMGNDFEYHNAPDKTAAAHSSDGYGTLGDIGYVDQDGYVFLSDRKIDMIISGGVNIYPAEIEGVLVTHPAVADAAVFGVPDDEFGEQVKAVVELVPGTTAGEDLERELIAHVRQHLAGYKAPRTVDVTEQLPRMPTGKLLKRQLRDPYWVEAGRTI